MKPLSNFVENFVKFARISSPGKAGGVSEGPRLPVEKKIQTNLRILPNFEVLDMDSIMLVIGLVKMLNFLKMIGDNVVLRPPRLSEKTQHPSHLLCESHG